MSNTPRTCTRTVIKSALWDKQKQYGIRPSLVPYCLFCFVLQCVAEYLVDTDQRNDLADKPRHQLFFAPPCSLRRCAMPRGLLRLRFGGADGLLSGEPPAIGPAIQVLFQFPQCGLVRLLRSAGAIVVEPDRQHRICLVCGEAAALPNALGGAWPHTPFSGGCPHPLLATIGEKHEKRYQIQHAHGVR